MCVQICIPKYIHVLIMILVHTCFHGSPCSMGIVVLISNKGIAPTLSISELSVVL